MRILNNLTFNSKPKFIYNLLVVRETLSKFYSSKIIIYTFELQTYINSIQKATYNVNLIVIVLCHLLYNSIDVTNSIYMVHFLFWKINSKIEVWLYRICTKMNIYSFEIRRTKYMHFFLWFIEAFNLDDNNTINSFHSLKHTHPSKDIKICWKQWER